MQSVESDTKLPPSISTIPFAYINWDKKENKTPLYSKQAGVIDAGDPCPGLNVA